MHTSVLTLPQFRDADLVRFASEGDRTAFGALYERYAPAVHAILLARVPVADAEDLVQEVFMTVMRKLPALRTPSAFPAWVAAIARNRALDYHRAAKVTAPLDEGSMNRERTGSNRIEAAHVLEVIRTLPEAYRETLIMRLVEGLTGPEIADRTGLTPDSVRVNLCRGMKRLREELGMELK